MSGAGMGIRPFRVWPRKAALRTVEKQVEPIKKWHIVRGDLVEILSGRDAGKTGKVKQVIRSENRVVVEGLNLVKRHVKVADGSAGGVVAVESPVHYSNINLVDPATGKHTRVAIKWTETGDKVRVSKRSGSIIPWPDAIKQRVSVRPVQPGPRDTDAAAVQRVTYNPPSELLPYLSRVGEANIYRVKKANKGDDIVPSVIRDVKLRRVNRNRIRRAWEKQVEKKRLDYLVSELAQQYMQAEMEKAKASEPEMQ